MVSAKDLYVLFNSVEAGRVCYGSDIPYGDIPSTLHAVLRAAEAAGVPEKQFPAVLSGNIRGGSLERVGRGAGADQPQG